MKKRDIFFVVLGTLFLLFAVFFVSLPKLKRHVEAVSCENCMSSICCAATIWAEDHDKRLPADFLSMSNALVAPQILICPGDHFRQASSNWASFTAKNTSYEIIAPAISENDTNTAYLRCLIHTNYLGYVYGYVFDGKRIRTKSSW